MSRFAGSTNTVALLQPWRPLYWEPVAGTGERLMVGVLCQFGGEIRAIRTVRDDVLVCLFGKSAASLCRLIEHGLSLYQAAACAAGSVGGSEVSLAGLHPGPIRETEARSVSDLLQVACLLYSSLANLDRLDDVEESDAPQQEEVNKRFSSELKDAVIQRMPELHSGFGQAARLIEGGELVRFGFLSPKAVIHFSVLHPVRQSASMRDARARIFELQRVRELSGVSSAALIAAVPRADDATLGSRQRESLRKNQKEIEAEADAVRLRWYAVNSATEGAERLIRIAA